MSVQSMDRARGPRPVRARSRFGRLRRSAAARWDADFLDGLVDAELEVVRRLPGHLRARPAEVLAVLTLLAQDHRYYAQGWINRRELRRRAQRALVDLYALRVQLDTPGLPR